MDRQTALQGPGTSRRVTALPTQAPATMSACVQIPSDRRAAGAARRFAAAVLYEWGCAELEDDAVLICSELATNAVVHGRTRPAHEVEHIRLDLTWQPGKALVIEVADNSIASPRPRDSGPSAESGRGLDLVDSLADRWASWTSKDGMGKKVRAHLRPHLGRKREVPPAQSPEEQIAGHC